MRKLPDRVWKVPRNEDDEAAEEGMGRILALSDGVFAIATTLLILEIAIPATTGEAGLPKALLKLWPQYLAYVRPHARASCRMARRGPDKASWSSSVRRATRRAAGTGDC
jgi:hypothetical protein